MRKKIIITILVIGGISFYLYKYVQYQEFTNQLRMERSDIREIILASTFIFSDLPESIIEINRSFEWHYNTSLDEKLKSLDYGINVYNDTVNKKYIIYSFGFDKVDSSMLNSINSIKSDSSMYYNIERANIFDFLFRMNRDIKLFELPHINNKDFCEHVYNKYESFQLAPELKYTLYSGVQYIDDEFRSSFIDEIEKFQIKLNKRKVDILKDDFITLIYRFKNNSLKLVCISDASQNSLDSININFTHHFKKIDKTNFDYAFFPVIVLSPPLQHD